MPSYLIIAKKDSKIFHILFGVDLKNDYVIIITAYKPVKKNGAVILKKGFEMKCYKCGGNLKKTNTDMPFKLNEVSLVVIKKLPVLQCENCNEYLIEDKVMKSVDELLSRVDKNTELEVLRFAV